MRTRCKQSLMLGVTACCILTLALPVFAAHELVARFTSEALTLDPGAVVWNNAQALTITLQQQTIVVPRGGGSVTEIKAKALHNGKQIAIRVNWQDPQPDRLNGVDSFKDAVAVQFPAHISDVAPSPFMGDAANPVNIWQWRADWQADAEGNRNLESEQPATTGVYISPNDRNVLKARYPYKYDAAAAAVEYSAVGWSTLTKQKKQNIKARGEYKNGAWSVVFLRDIQRQDESDAEFVPGKHTHINFAVWNGGRNEVNGKKSVSFMWHTLTLSPMQ
jgi:DMSO reductase family type II enzyme heme b subunit